MPRKKEALHFDPFCNPARRHWIIDAGVPRDLAHVFLEHLEDLCVPDGGARFYFPTVDGSTSCRFEWTWKCRSWPQLLRLGVMFTVDSQQVTEIEGFVTTNRNIKHPGAPIPELPKDIVDAAARRIVDRLQEASHLTTTGATSTYHYVLHMKCGGGVGIPEEVSVFCGTSKVVPTVVIRDRRQENERVSAVVHRVEAPTAHAARRDAIARHALLCALATLTTSIPFAPYSPRWTRRRPRREFVRSMSVAAGRLYPNHVPLPASEASEWFPSAFQNVVAAFEALSAEDREVFVAALLSYSGGREICGKQGTLAVVSYIAGLNLLAAAYTAVCPGELTCSVHGPLSWKHKDTGDAAAITKMATALLSLEPGSPQARSVKKLIRGVYSVQRSAFVHAAELRHGEHGQERTVTACPGPNGRQFSKLAEYAHDLDSVQHLMRRILLAWLEDRTGIELSLGDYQPDARIQRSRALDACTHTSRTGSVLRIAPYADGEIERLKAEWAAAHGNQEPSGHA